MRIKWLRTHVPIRNGHGGIGSAFFEPDYQIELRDRVFYISRKDVLATSTPIENVVEFTADEIQEETTAKAKRQTSKV